MHLDVGGSSTRRSLWHCWTLYCGAGELLGITIAAGSVAAILAVWGEPTGWLQKVITLTVLTLAGALEGLFVASLQWLVLRQWIPSVPAMHWISVTVMVAALGWLLGMAPFTLLTPSEEPTTAEFPEMSPFLSAALSMPLGLVLGAAFGAAQWLVLRRHAHKAALWIMGNALGWAVAMAWIFLMASLPAKEADLFMIIALGAAAGILAGLLLGAVYR